jgi:hypothetical protein
VTEEARLIDQVLAATAAAPPPRLGGELPITPAQALVKVIYLAVLDKRQGRTTDVKVAQYVRTARSAGIPDEEIQAAIDRAGAAEL